MNLFQKNVHISLMCVNIIIIINNGLIALSKIKICLLHNAKTIYE